MYSLAPLYSFSTLWLPVGRHLWAQWPRSPQESMHNRPGDIQHVLQRFLRPEPCCNWSSSRSVTRIMTSSPSRGVEERERKTVCTHPSMSISNYCATNHQRRSIGSVWEGGLWWCDGRMKGGEGGSEDAHWKTEESLINTKGWILSFWMGPSVSRSLPPARSYILPPPHSPTVTALALH